MNDKAKLAMLLGEIAVMLELAGENPFKARAYQIAAATIERLEGELEALVAKGSLGEIKGIGKALSAKVEEFVRTGGIAYHAELKAAIPPVLFELIKIPGLGPKKALILHNKLGIQSIGELEYACRENRLVGLPGFGEKTQQKILQGIEYVKKFQGQFLLVDAWPLAEKIAEYLSAHDDVLRAEVAGSIRRRSEIVKDIDIVVAAHSPESVAAIVANMPGVMRVTGAGSAKISGVLSAGMNLNIHIAPPPQFAAALHYFTGSGEHHTALQDLARDKGYTIHAHGLEAGDGSIIAPQTEQELYAALGLSYIAPELREGAGEVEAAAGHLPELVAEDRICGVFHIHTHYSDGSVSLSGMAQAAKERGWQYLGIADHSRTAVYAGGLAIEAVREQRREIDKLNALDAGFTIFAGIESDILPDGSLDYPDEILAEFDFVIASVHSAFRQSEADMTRRIIRAMENRYVTMLGHPTGRILLAREGYSLDMPAVIRAAADTGTIIEINASPYRLDIDWRWHRQAREAGVLFSVNPDAHAADELDYVRFGVAMARKGWLTPADILNTRDVTAVKKLLRRKQL
ncbi:MAG: DNA polymerase/3'-5' exonuclease PolX [Negativicutes bacterium]|nr:DNA polymerase/3'-5' exonuclease PolX [Negativicutes bacterium]